jgi:hypothetical protein
VTEDNQLTKTHRNLTKIIATMPCRSVSRCWTTQLLSTMISLCHHFILCRFSAKTALKRLKFCVPRAHPHFFVKNFQTLFFLSFSPSLSFFFLVLLFFSSQPREKLERDRERKKVQCAFLFIKCKWWMLMNINMKLKDE